MLGMNNRFNIHHVGIVVKDCVQAANEYAVLNMVDNSRMSSQIVESQNIKIVLIKENDNNIEFIEPLNEKSTVYNFLIKSANGAGGLHHMCYEVETIEAGIEHFSKVGRLISAPVIGLNGKKVAFFYLRSNNMGMRIVEIVEK